MEQYLTLAGCLILGQILHLIVKADNTYEEFIVSNKEFSFRRDFLVRNIFKIILAFLSGIVSLVLYSEAIGVYEQITTLQKTIFLTIGYSGSSIVLKYLNRNVKRVEAAIEDRGAGEEKEEPINTQEQDHAEIPVRT